MSRRRQPVQRDTWRIKIVCRGRGTHDVLLGRWHWWPGGWESGDGAHLFAEPRLLVTNPQGFPRPMRPGETLRYDCPRCGTDRPYNRATATRLAERQYLCRMSTLDIADPASV